jgi:formylglycine-generating enzyme required for sulfatase activity
LQLGRPETVWPLFRHSPDPSRRTYLIHDLARLGTAPGPIIKSLRSETDVSIRRALILSLGEFSAEQLQDEERESLVPQLLEWYRTDPDPGVHSALDWLLRNNRRGNAPRNLDWRQREAVERIDRELVGQPPQGRHWYVNRQKQTLAIIRGPGEFLMGAVGPEAKRLNAPPHRVTVANSFAIATRKVSVAEFQRFLDTHPAIKKPEFNNKYNLGDDGPILGVTWFEAAQYCNWLSQQDGIPRDKWCYPELDATKPGMEPSDYAVKRTGYRLPTEAEWEFACRAGSSTIRFYGSAQDMLDEYAWLISNTTGAHTGRLGQLKPNDFGLFDVYGNAWEWCQDRVGDSGETSPPPIDRAAGISALQNRVVRGSSFASPLWFGCSVSRLWAHAGDRNFNLGLRVARTCR